MTTDGTSGIDLMSPYERTAWEESVGRVNRKKEGRVRRAAGAATAPATKRIAKAWDTVPGHNSVEDAVLQTLGELKAVTFDPALRSVNADKVLRQHGVSSAEELRSVDLKKLDRSLPVVRTLYAGSAGIEGGMCALAVTGAEVSSAVSGGVTLGVAVGAIAVDVASSVALLGRVIGRVAAEYGYDVRLPEEEAYALGVMSLGAAATAAEKAAALASLRRLTTQMMRHATWAHLNHNGWVILIQKVYSLLGERLTHRKLAQAVPFAGVIINAGMSAQMVDSAYRAARDVYRLRFLSEKYDIDPRSWTQEVVVALVEDDPLARALDMSLSSSDESPDQATDS